MRDTLLTFILIFLAALPGRTTFILFILGTSTHPLRILTGALPAFIIQCALAVVIGQSLKQIPSYYMQVAAGVGFIYFAVRFWSESLKSENVNDRAREKSVMSIFLLFFMAELGDVSQLAIAARAAFVDSQLSVFLGAAFAMSSLAVLAVFAGRLLRGKLSPPLLQKIAAGAFFLLGSYVFALGVRGFTHPT